MIECEKTEYIHFGTVPISFLALAFYVGTNVLSYFFYRWAYGLKETSQLQIRVLEHWVRDNGRLFKDFIFKSVFLYENNIIVIHLSIKSLSEVSFGK